MNRIQLACYGLIASAFALAGLLMMSLQSGGGNPAMAEMVIARDDFGLMTAQTRSGGESLFVLDNASGRLLIYNLDVNDKQLQLVGNVDLIPLFAQAGNVQPGRGGGAGR